jgi:hypothetical protein
MSDAEEISRPATGQPDVDSATNTTSGGGSSASPKLAGAALWTAILAVAVWVGFSIFLIAKASTSETEWTRIAWVFGSIQAIAFAAAGALFGTTVQQQNVSTAQQQAESAKKDADQQRDAATKGRVLAMTIQAEAAAQPINEAEFPQHPGAAEVEAADQLRQRHAQISRALFGNLV